MSGQAANYLAGGTIRPSRFVKHDPSNDDRVVECGMNQMSCGISQEGTENAPISGASANAATSGNPIKVYGPGDTRVLLLLGANVTRGQPIRSHVDATGIPLATSGEAQKIGAWALESRSSGELCRVRIQPMVTPAGASV